MTNITIETANKCELLIFEDEDSMQTILSAALMPEKFHLEFVSKNSIGSLGAFKPKIVLLDQAVPPVLSEENFCERIKTFYPNVPLIVISAYPLDKFGNYNRHIDLFIAKPFDLSYFLNCIALFDGSKNTF